MKAAIIGTGLLGEKIYQNISKFCEEIILTHNKNKKYHDSKKFDFFNDDINDIFDNKQIDLVILSAKIEFEENSEKLRNAMEHFLDTCKNSRLVYISSDGIFDGKKGMYSESDVPNPVTLYGRNLKLCENLVKEYSDNFCIVRPNYMYGIEEASIDGRMKRVLEDLKDGKEEKDSQICINLP